MVEHQIIPSQLAKILISTICAVLFTGNMLDIWPQSRQKWKIVKRKADKANCQRYSFSPNTQHIRY